MPNQPLTFSFEIVLNRLILLQVFRANDMHWLSLLVINHSLINDFLVKWFNKSHQQAMVGGIIHNLDRCESLKLVLIL